VQLAFNVSLKYKSVSQKVPDSKTPRPGWLYFKHKRLSF